MKELGLILLAAGTSSRMRGSHKLLLPLQGEPIVTRSLRAYEAISFSQKVVVLGHQADVVAGAITRIARDPGSIQFVRNEDYEAGLRSSLQAGIRALRPEIGGVLVALADQPFVDSETAGQVAQAFLESAVESNPGSPRLFAPYSEGKRGNPVIVSRSLFQEILEENGDDTYDQGARFLFQKYPEAIERIEVQTPAIHMDIDTPEDYQKFQLRSQEAHL